MEEFTLDELIDMCPSGEEIWEEVQSFGRMLLEKNFKYGDSALAPVSVFCGLPAHERLMVRMDDKISRIREQMLSATDDDEDPALDLAGYIILSRVEAKRREQ